MRVGRRSPFYDLGEVLSDEALVVWLDLIDVDGLIALAVEVVRVERADSLERTRIVRIGQVRVCALAVPWVERVVADHVECINGERALFLENVVEVLKASR